MESESFWIAIATMSIGLIYGVLKLINNSKCKSCNILWGCCIIVRDIENEVKEHHYNVENKINDNIEITKP